MKHFIFLFIATLFFASCNSGGDENNNNNNDTAVTPPVESQQTTPPPPMQENTQTIDMNTTPGTTGTPESTPSDPAFSGKPNPPHGEPGHRCDIAVGAPLP